jgi:hypothetical protein
MDANILHI